MEPLTVTYIWLGVSALFLWVFILLGARITAKSREKVAARVAEVLKIYADKGEEPPQSVTDALMALVAGSSQRQGTGGLPLNTAPAPAAPSPPKPPLGRGEHFSAFARDLVVALGAAGMAWWRSPGPGEHPGGFMTLALVVALIFTAGAVWHLATAFQMRDGQ